MDWDHIEQLLNIGKLSAEHGPRYTPIVSAVQLELEQHLAEAKKIVEEKAKAEVEEFNRKKAEAADKALKTEEDSETVGTVESGPYAKAKAVSAAEFNSKAQAEKRAEEEAKTESDPTLRRI